MSMLDLPRPYLLFLGDTPERGYAKTALGLRDWAPEQCIGECGLPGGITIDLPRYTPRDAQAAGARSLVIGVANPGGFIPDSWLPVLLDALEAGLDLVGGLHTKLNDVPVLAEAAARLNRRLIDVRTPPPNIPVANGKKRTGQRLLTVGTDCALGKKYTALALASAFKQRGVDADFRATGQTGIMIAGSGMPIDAVVSDFVAGAAEMLSPDNKPGHWDVVEGQGSLFHPAYAGVSLGLLHGSQPDVIVVCHDPARTHVLGYPSYKLPTIPELVDLALTLGSRVNPGIRCAGVSLNTHSLDAAAAANLLARERDALKMPVADPIRRGRAFDELVDACLGADR
jgi:uncharacterized NAD-dependent epimerase/dehydratase family protein